MEIRIKESSKTAEFWLTNSDQRDEVLMSSVRGLCAEYKAKNFYPVLYLSGRGDLLKNTTGLLIHQLHKSI